MNTRESTILESEIAASKFNIIKQEFGITHSEANPCISPHSAPNLCIYLVIYVDNIVITSYDEDGIAYLKQYLFQHFTTKDLIRLKYFLSIEVAQSRSNITISP